MAADVAKVRLVTWEEIQEWARNLSLQMIDDGFVPDVIIGITRGGWVPASLLSDCFQLKDLHTIKIEHHGITRSRSGKAILAEPLYINLYDKKVLILDDVSNSGQTLLYHRVVDDGDIGQCGGHESPSLVWGRRNVATGRNRTMRRARSYRIGQDTLDRVNRQVACWVPPGRRKVTQRTSSPGGVPAWHVIGRL